MSTPPACGPARSSRRSPRPVLSGRRSPSTRITSSAIPAAIPATSYARTGSYRSGPRPEGWRCACAGCHQEWGGIDAERAIVTSAESDFLLRLAALSLSFVGFSSVVVTLRGALGGKLSDRHLRLVRLYIEGGFLVTALGLLPTLLNLLHVDESITWRVSSAAAALIFTLVLVRQFRRRRVVEGRFPPWVIVIFAISAV